MITKPKGECRPTRLHATRLAIVARGEIAALRPQVETFAQALVTAAEIKALLARA